MALITNSNNSETFKYIPVSCRGDESPFSVTIKRLDKKSFTKLEDGLTKVSQDDATISFASGSFNWGLVKRGVVGWENITDKNSAQLKFVKDANGFMDDSSIEALPFDIITEIANVIANITRKPEHTDLFLGTFSTETVASATA
jgi:hypothetical protein